MSKIKALQQMLEKTLIEREEEIEAILLGLLAQEHVLLVGDPGLAKSQLATNFAKGIDARVFARLLSKYSTPEEIFGPYKLSSLKQDVYERQYYGYAPDAEIVFFDEIWKASVAIVNTILTLLQERQFDNGTERIDVPLELCVAASNEWPVGEGYQECGAIFDRFLIRKEVKRISRANRRRLLYEALPEMHPVITLEEVHQAQAAAEIVPFSQEAIEAMDEILDELEANGIVPSDRRMRKAVKVAKAKAVLEGEAEVQKAHLEPLKYVLWNNPIEQPEKCASIVLKIANPVGFEIQNLLREVAEILQGINSQSDRTDEIKAIKALEECEQKAIKMQATGNGRVQKAIEYIKKERIRLQARSLGLSEESMAQLLK